MEPTDPTVVVYPDSAVTFALVFCILFIVVGLIGNGLTILAVMGSRKLRASPTSMFIVSLSITDLIFCVFNLPLTATRYYHRGWVLGEALCKLFPFFFYLNVAASLFNMMAITINRYVILAHYNSYDRLYCARNVVYMLLMCWLVPIGLLTPTLFDLWGYFGYAPTTFSCTILKDEAGRSPKKFFFLLGFFLPCVVILLCYSRIICIVRSSRLAIATHSGSKSRSGQVDEVSLTRLVAVIFVTFLFCYLPLMAVNVFDETDSVPVVHVVASVLAWSASVINPVIYGAMSARYRQAYKKVLPSWLCPRHRHSGGSTVVTSVSTHATATAATQSGKLPNIRLSSLNDQHSCGDSSTVDSDAAVLTERV